MKEGSASGCVRDLYRERASGEERRKRETRGEPTRRVPGQDERTSSRGDFKIGKERARRKARTLVAARCRAREKVVRMRGARGSACEAGGQPRPSAAAADGRGDDLCAGRRKRSGSLSKTWSVRGTSSLPSCAAKLTARTFKLNISHFFVAALREIDQPLVDHIAHNEQGSNRRCRV